ncbi:MAG: TonB-dependent receptor [Synergistaceae bacterium]|nr:TonB-dependent receptor [Synergistota bacterium]NLM72363.1 TonB-dependent receptor [Synergistaceae bacterium]
MRVFGFSRANAVALFIVLCCSTQLAAFEAELPEQIVTADVIGDEEPFSPGAVTVVRPEEMEGEQKSLPDLLKRVPGLHVIEARGRGAYTVASVRGSTSAQVAVYVDGVLANLGSESAVDLSTIPVSDVEAIEVYRGYVPSRFNRASMGGVINIVTKRPTSAGGSASLGASSWGGKSGALSWSTPLGDGRFYLGASAERSDGDFEYRNDNDTPYTPEDDYDARRRHNHFDRKNLLLKWEDDDWHARLSWREDERGLPPPAPGFDRPDEPRPRGAWLGTDQWSVSVGRRYVSGEFDWGWRADWLDRFKEYNDPDDVIGGLGERHNEYRSRRVGFAVDASLPIGDSHLAELLIDWSSENLDVRGDVVQRLGGRDSFSQDSLNVHLQDTISLGREGNLLFTPLLRWSAQDGEGRFSWSAGLVQEFGNGLSWRASFGSYNRYPNLYERYGDGASIRPAPDLKWEEGTRADLGVMWSGEALGFLIDAEATLFAGRSKNLIEFVMTSPRFGIYQNIGESRVYGLEVESTMRRDPWEVFTSFTWMDAVNETPGDYRHGMRLPNRPELEGLLRVARSIAGGRGSLFTELHYTGDMYFDSAETVRSGNLLTVGAGGKYDLSDSLRVSAGVDDLFNRGPEVLREGGGTGPDRTMYYPFQGRSFYLTLDWFF